MTDVAGITIAGYVRSPFKFAGISVAGTDMTGLKLFELLLRTKFIGLSPINVSYFFYIVVL